MGSFCNVDGFSVSKSGFSSCVNETVFTAVPFIFLCAVAPRRLQFLNSLPAKRVFEGRIDILLSCLTLVQMLLDVATVAEVYRSYNDSKAFSALRSYSFVLGNSLNLLTWLLSYVLLRKRISCEDKIKLLGLKGFWRINLLCSCCTSLSYIPMYESRDGSTLLTLSCAKFALSIIFGVFSLECAFCYKRLGIEARGNILDVSLQQTGSKFLSIDVNDPEYLLDVGNDKDYDCGLLDISVDETTRRECRPSSFDTPHEHNRDMESKY